MSEITEAIAAKQAQISQLQSDIETLQRAATVLGGKTTAKVKRKRRAAAKKQHVWSAADREAISKRMKASWAKRRKAKG